MRIVVFAESARVKLREQSLIVTQDDFVPLVFLFCTNLVVMEINLGNTMEKYVVFVCEWTRTVSFMP